MLFSSWQFIFLFLPITLLGFFLVPARLTGVRKVWLLGASLFFYGYWKVEYVPLLLFSIAFNYTVAEVINRQRNRPGARTAILTGVSVNLLLLGYYKYTNFILQAFGWAVQKPVAHFDIILPLAISFFTFTQISYLVDIYRDQALHYRFLDYALFVLFFPHLIAGPIVRHWEIIPQFSGRTLKANLADFRLGAALFLIGLYKKVLLADGLAPYISTVYGAAGQGVVLTWFDAWLGTLAFALQIYFDFSGYSDMAIGLARLFGIRFPINFASPYQADSINEFWRRWHITLTRFLREYVYFPIGGNRCGPWRHALNILFTMLLSGLWHGAGWTFVIWGGLHGIFMVIAHRWRKLRETLGWKWEGWWYRTGAVTLTFVSVLFTWVFFRAPTLPVAGRVLASMLGLHGLTMGDNVTNPTRIPGRWWAHLGIQFVPANLQVESYTRLLQWMLPMLLLVFLFPNSQQILKDHIPALEKVERAGWFRLRLGWGSGLLLGAAFFVVLRGFYVAAPSPFLYFNF